MRWCTLGVQWRRFSQLAPRSPPLWWQQGWPRQRAGSVAEAELLAPLGELLMPGMPVREMFRSFKSPAGWGGNYLEPDLTAYGLLKDQNAALFVEYDGYYRHATKEGMDKDLLKNAALLEFAPVGSFVVRIGHKGRSRLDGQVLWVNVNSWRPRDSLSLKRSLQTALEETVHRLRHALHPNMYRCLEERFWIEQPMLISQSALDFREAALVKGKGNTAKEVSNHLHANGFGPADIDRLQERALVGRVSIERTLHPLLRWLTDLGLTKSQIAKAIATYPQILGCSLEHNLKPTMQWFLDLGLTQSQVAKAVTTFPHMLGYSLEHNLKPTVECFLDLGLSKDQIVKVVATFPQILGLSLKHNLKPTVKWFLDLGLTKDQIVKVVATSPQILCLSLEHNLKPTVNWFLHLGLTERQLAKAMADFPSILGLSIDNLTCKAKLLELFYTSAGIVQLIAKFPRILSFSQQRLQDRLRVLSEQGSLAKVTSAMVLTDEEFHKRFLAQKRCDRCDL